MMTLPTALQTPFKLIAFDWDGTAVTHRLSNAQRVSQALDALLARGVVIGIITGTHKDNVLNQIGPFIHHWSPLYLLTNRGSEVFGFDGQDQMRALYQLTATPQQNAQLDAVAHCLHHALAERAPGLPVALTMDRLNRRKIDLNPAWADPPKAQIDHLWTDTQQKLVAAGLLGGLGEALSLAEACAEQHQMQEPHLTSDVKHIEVGLSDKGDSARWLVRQFDFAPTDMVFAGDEFGPVSNTGPPDLIRGSDARMMDACPHATFLTVGVEPHGVPDGVISLPGGPATFIQFLEAQHFLWLAVR
jgi:hydroxymethylpyrimidine pyrophosphatase-like HAD family hydrolase